MFHGGGKSRGLFLLLLVQLEVVPGKGLRHQQREDQAGIFNFII